MNTSNLLNENGVQATIKILSGHPEDHIHHKVVKTWDQLTDSNKQDIASRWIKDHVNCNVNQVMELLAQNEDHIDYDSYREVAEQQDYQYAVESDLNDKTIDELIEIIEEHDLGDDVDYVQVFKDNYLADLIENTSNTNFTIAQAYHAIEITFLSPCNKEEEEYTIEEIEKELITFFMSNLDNITFDDLDTCITDLGINFDGYLKAYQSDLSDLISKHIDDDQYGQDNDLDPEYNEAYEFWSVSDHFVAMLQDNEECSNDILGLSVWARYCTGQSICLDRAIQVTAFKVLSDCSYTNY